MIIVKLTGGLGNQLFQYAFARSVSLHLKTDFRLDSNPFYTYYKLHKYSLEHFNIKQRMAKNSDFLGFIWFRKQNKIFDTFYKYLRLKSKLMPFYYPEQTFRFDASVFSKNGTYFDGFWQTEKYFKDIENIIRKEATIKTPLQGKDKQVAKEIEATTSIAMHIRRGDYVTNKQTNEYHGACGMDYYRKAIGVIAEKVSNPHIFIFSDDHEWVKNNIVLEYPVTYVDHNKADKNYEDLRLMSLCKHQIIANSSFSWWGAWLNPNKEKIVIAPKHWFQTSKMDTRDLLPDSWIKL